MALLSFKKQETSDRCVSKLYALGKWVKDETYKRPYGFSRWNVTSDEGARDGGNINAGQRFTLVIEMRRIQFRLHALL